MDDNLLCLHIIAIHQTEHIYARRNIDGFADAAIDGLAAQDVAHHVDHLQRSFASDDDVAIVDERKRLIVAICIPAAGKH